jgi:SAM-dependent methyltransferase
MSDLDFSANVERFTGFGFRYDQVRPSPPAVLADFLLPLAGCERAGRVVDLGCGTGLSTRYWPPHADEVIGVEPTDSMREQAEQAGGANISYVKGYSHATGLADGSADVVICSQALHWMDPVATFPEVSRILRTGGVFAAYDYDWPPSTSAWEVDQAYADCMDHARGLERKHGLTEKLQQWDKDRHLERMRQSGCFRHVRETLLHHHDEGGAERIVGLFLSQGYVRSLMKIGLFEEQLEIPYLRQVAERVWGSHSVRWLWSARMRWGVK